MPAVDPTTGDGHQCAAGHAVMPAPYSHTEGPLLP